MPKKQRKRHKPRRLRRAAAQRPIGPDGAPIDWLPKYLDRTDLPVGTIARWARLDARELSLEKAKILMGYAADKLTPRLIEMINSDDFESLAEVVRIVCQLQRVCLRIREQLWKQTEWTDLRSSLFRR